MGAAQRDRLRWGHGEQKPDGQPWPAAASGGGGTLLGGQMPGEARGGADPNDLSAEYQGNQCATHKNKHVLRNVGGQAFPENTEQTRHSQTGSRLHGGGTDLELKILWVHRWELSHRGEGQRMHTPSLCTAPVTFVDCEPTQPHPRHPTSLWVSPPPQGHPAPDVTAALAVWCLGHCSPWSSARARKPHCRSVCRC